MADEMVERNDRIRSMRLEGRMSLQSIANLYGISRERVRQIAGNSGNVYWAHKKDQFNNILISSNDKTNREIQEEYGLSLHSISMSKTRTKERHAIELDCNAGRGAAAEIMVSNKLTELGINHQLMSHHHPFDILVDDRIRVNVKSAWSNKIPPSLIGRCVNNRYHFGLQRRSRDNADIFILVIANTKDMFIVPNSDIPPQMTSIYITYPSARPDIGKFQKYLNRWDTFHYHVQKCTR